MKQHPIDPVSLVSGLALLLVAGGYTVSNATSAHLHWLFVAPAALIVVGVGILAAVARRVSTTNSERATIDDDADTRTTG
jgi:cytochrome c-type biogenesis protein CcmH/NrfF